MEMVTAGVFSISIGLERVRDLELIRDLPVRFLGDRRIVVVVFDISARGDIAGRWRVDSALQREGAWKRILFSRGNGEDSALERP